MAILAITPSDGTAIAGGPVRKLYAGTAVSGAIAVIDIYGNTAVLSAWPAATWITFGTPVAFVKATGTTGVTGVVGDTLV